MSWKSIKDFWCLWKPIPKVDWEAEIKKMGYVQFESVDLGKLRLYVRANDGRRYYIKLVDPLSYD